MVSNQRVIHTTSWHFGSGDQLVLADRVARALGQASATRLPGFAASGGEPRRPAQTPCGSVGFVFQDVRSLITTNLTKGCQFTRCRWKKSAVERFSQATPHQCS